MRRSILLLLALLATGALAAVLPAGCAGGVPCELNSDCPFGYCQSGSCQKNCVDASRDCPSGFICDQNAECVPPGGTGGASSSSSGATTSTGGAGGAGGTSSTTGTGAVGPSTSSGAGAGTSSASSTSASSTASSTSSTTTTAASSTSSSTTSSTSGGTMSEHELDLCTSDGDCASPLVCRPLVPGGAQRCTHPCTLASGCTTAGMRCNTTAGYCAADDTGRACTAAATCNFGCLGALYCTNSCNVGADCPNGYGCMADGGQRICVRAEAPCDGTDTSACIGPLYCDTSTQMVVGGCTLACSSASDCPQRAAGFAAWTCDVVMGVCRRPPDVFGPLQNGATPAQYACNAADETVNVCNDAQHIDYQAFDIPMAPVVSCTATTTTAGNPTDSCVDSCRYQGSCLYGFACVGVGSIQSGTVRIGLCLPTGGGEVGASCTHDSDCVFGYCPSALGKCSRDCTGDGVCPSGTTCTAAGGPPVEGAPFRRCQ